MMQQLLRRLVFDVPMLNEYCKIPLRVSDWTCLSLFCLIYELDKLGDR